MSRYTRMLFATVEMSPEGGRGYSGDLMFMSSSLDEAQKLFEAVKSCRLVDRQYEPVRFGLNLVLWDRHPSQDEAVGHIIRQESVGGD